MNLTRSSLKRNFEALLCYNSILDCPFGIHTSLTADGIPSYRIVFLNTEARDVNETITDNGTVGYLPTAGSTGTLAGVVKDGCEPEDGITYLPGFNRDRNVTVTLLGTMILEAAPGAVIPVGDIVGSDPVGRATAGGASGIVSLSATTGSGTADQPEFIIALVKN